MKRQEVSDFAWAFGPIIIVLVLAALLLVAVYKARIGQCQ